MARPYEMNFWSSYSKHVAWKTTPYVLSEAILPKVIFHMPFPHAGASSLLVMPRGTNKHLAALGIYSRQGFAGEFNVVLGGDGVVSKC